MKDAKQETRIVHAEFAAGAVEASQLPPPTVV